MKAINAVIPEPLIVTEVGQNQMWAAQYLRIEKPRRWLTSGGLGTMGYGFPAALGAQAAKPRDTVVVVAGDGSFQMNIQELATSVQEGLPVIVVILNNGYLGMVRQWQELFFDKRYSAVCLDRHGGCPADCSAPKKGCSAHSPDFAAIAAAYGAAGYRASSLRELEEALAAALETRRACRRPSVIDCRIGREENVWPIVPPGKGNDQMLYEGVLV
jgi:acetolactate synthase-1/2/3 large subunit